MVDPLPNVLKKLTNEVMGLLSAYEPGLRELIGHTNYNVLKVRAEAGREALARPRRRRTEEIAKIAGSSINILEAAVSPSRKFETR